MKLRLRSPQFKETLDLDVPDDCSVQKLQDFLVRSLVSPSVIRLSLSGSAELSPQSPDTSLHSIGITSGDLIYYDLSIAQQGNASSNLQRAELCNEIVVVESDHGVLCFEKSSEIPKESVSLNFSDQNRELDDGVLDFERSSEIPEEYVSLNCSNHNNELQESTNKGKSISFGHVNLENGMDADSGLNWERLSEPCVLKRILCEGMGNDFSDSKLMFLSVHAVFLGSGFVGFNSLCGSRVDNFDILKECTSRGFTTTLSYTVPELLLNENGAQSIVLKFLTLGRFVDVYGSLAKGRASVRKLFIDKRRFILAISRLHQVETDSTLADAGEAILEFWKLVKHALAWPLMIDLCEETGLVLPPCFTRLPAFIKFLILELLPGQDIAKMACVCKEMRSLSSDNDLWKAKSLSEFGVSARFVGNWKARFVSCWENMKRRERGRRVTSAHHPPYPLMIAERFPRFGPVPFGNLPGVYGSFYRAPNRRLR